MTATASRYDLDYDYVISSLLNNISYSKIADRETVRLGKTVGRGLIAGVDRDLKAGRLKITALKPAAVDGIPSYIYGVEPDNGGIPIFTGHLTLDGSIVVTNDWHSPFIDTEFATSVVAWAKYYGIKTMLIAGDMTDGNSQNSFKRKVLPVSYTKELEVARQLLFFYADWFTKIVFELSHSP